MYFRYCRILGLQIIFHVLHEIHYHFRSEEQGDDIYLRRYEHFPEYYRAANLQQGLWTAPYFDCEGLVKMWKITYAAPFFGWDSLRQRIEFKGAVAVSMDIK